ncbi:MAG: hypothetical protein R3E77_09115 [Steroidobacteraceae bacterium]
MLSSDLYIPTYLAYAGIGIGQFAIVAALWLLTRASARHRSELERRFTFWSEHLSTRVEQIGWSAPATLQAACNTAIRLAKEGHSTTDIVKSLQFPESEAELVIKLHGRPGRVGHEVTQHTTNCSRTDR